VMQHIIQAFFEQAKILFVILFRNGDTRGNLGTTTMHLQSANRGREY
jgi:hypothetical protein